MKKTLSLVLVVVLIITGLISGCGGVVSGSGNLETRTFDYTNFTKVEAQSGFHVEITRSSTYSIRVTVDDNIWEYLDVDKSGDTLVIRFTGNRLYSSVTKEAVITMPEIERIRLSGGSQGEVTGFSSSNDFTAELSGGSGLEGTISTGNAELKMSGGSRISLTGSSKGLGIDSSGGSRAELDDFSVTKADIKISGGGSADINMDGILNAYLSGGSRIRYTGNLELGELALSGASTVSKK